MEEGAEAVVATKICAGSAEDGRRQLRRQVEWLGCLDTVRLPYNPLERAWERELLLLAQELGVARVGSPPCLGPEERRPVERPAGAR